MTRRFAMALALTLLAGATIHAQKTPDIQQPASQENPEDESTTRRKARPHDYRNWSFNVGIGANLPSGTTKTFVRGGGVVGEAGAARNYSKYFAFRLDFSWANLPLRTSALELAQAPTGTDYMYGLMLDPMFSIPVTKRYTVYALVGPSFYRRTGKLDSSTVVPGTECNAFWTWWGTCFAGSVPLNKNFLRTNQNEFGLNFGGGVARKVTERIEIYGELRYLHGKHDGTTTDLRPITIGVRW
jgi:opacity protein-like surface antigen